MRRTLRICALQQKGKAMKNDELMWRRDCAERAAIRRQAEHKLRPRHYPQAVRRDDVPTWARLTARRNERRRWRCLAVTCVLWALALTVGAAVVYGIATVPAGWWLPGGLPW